MKIKKSAPVLLFKYFKTQKNLSIYDFAYILGMQVQSVRNKFNRETFSIEDLMALCIATDTEFKVGDYVVDCESYFKDQPERLSKIKSWTNTTSRSKFQELEELEERIRELRKELNGR